MVGRQPQGGWTATPGWLDGNPRVVGPGWLDGNPLERTVSTGSFLASLNDSFLSVGQRGWRFRLAPTRHVHGVSRRKLLRFGGELLVVDDDDFGTGYALDVETGIWRAGGDTWTDWLATLAHELTAEVVGSGLTGRALTASVAQVQRLKRPGMVDQVRRMLRGMLPNIRRAGNPAHDVTECHVRELNADTRYIGVANGVVDLRRGELLSPEQGVARAKALLAQAGHGDGFALRIDTLTSPPFPAIARTLRATFAEAGIDAQVVIWEGAELWPRYRAREHELILAPWSPDYVDSHSNADAFARNPDNCPETNLTGVLAWRNAWAREEFNAAVVRARNELDPGRRAQLYRDLQRRLQDEGPYVIMFQQTEQMARRRTAAGLVTGPAFDQTWYRTVTKQPATAR